MPRPETARIPIASNRYGPHRWAWATWGTITGWVGYGWSEPIYYGYGDTVYYGDQPVASAEEYAQQAEQIATSVPQADPAKVEWMPLGVFALTPDGQSSGPPLTMFLQLAVSKEGIIAGPQRNRSAGAQVCSGLQRRAKGWWRRVRGERPPCTHRQRA